MFPLAASRAIRALIAAFGFGVFGASLVVARAQVAADPPAQSSPAISNTPRSELSPVDLGDALMYHKRYQAAITAYESAPHKTADLWNKMGISYQMMLNFADATRCYKESLQFNPRDPSVLNNLGTALQSLGDYGHAERMYKKAIQIDPNFALGYKNLATSLMARRKYKQGREADARALAIDPAAYGPGSGDGLTVANAVSVRDRGAMNYYMAIDCARAGQTACALQHLRLALNQGFISPGKVAADSNFAALSGNPAFQQLLTEQTAK